MKRLRRKKVPRLSHLFQKAVRYQKCNNRRRLFDLIERVPELLNHWERDVTLLLRAVWRKQYGIVEWLLQHGADPDLVEEGGNTPLIHAAVENDVRLVQLLLDFSADVEKPNDSFESPLGFACAYDAVDAVRLLCERGADVNGVEGWGRSYLCDVQSAIEGEGPESKQTEIQQILLSFGAKVIHEAPKLRWDEQLGSNVRVDSGKLV